ncbi:CBS domain-containing protein [Nocardia sp. CA-119907]|uniref:CBS domain-containing protein n=1 Tax=Nocardia sp. CA-119907 TaxID=3239973 RepID=UPI003D96DC71
MNSRSMKARDIMHADAEWIPADETLDRAAQMMRRLDVGGLPIGNNDRLVGMLTDRDIVVKCVAMGHDPSKVRAGDLAEGTPRWVSDDADVREVLDTMEREQIKRIPVVNANKRLVGMICESDIAKNLTDAEVAKFVSAVSVPH